MKRLAGVLAASYCVAASSCFAAFTVGSDTDTGGWIAISGNYDYLADQQTGQPSSDIVGGTGYDAGFFTNWDGGNVNSSVDGTLGFRVRLDEKDGNNSLFTGSLWVGIDANGNGGIDAFVGVSKESGNNYRIGVYDPGAGLNNSPSSTTIDVRYLTSADLITSGESANYNYRAVNILTDGGTTNDITTGTSGDVDYYVTFTVDFSKLVNFLGTQGITINDGTALRYVIGTATQGNSLNQDLGNINNQTANLNNTWEQLGGFSPSMTATGTVVPEPSAALLGGLGMLGLLRRRRN